MNKNRLTPSLIRCIFIFWAIFVATLACAEGTPVELLPLSNMAVIKAGTNSGKDPDGREYSLTVKTFYMDRREVTKALWDDVAMWGKTHGYQFDNPGGGKAPDHPVHSINWFDCVKWCNARSEKEGRPLCYLVDGKPYKSGKEAGLTPNGLKVDFTVAGYRLPTDAEWEYAARGGLQGKRFPWGDEIDHDKANYLGHSLVISYDKGYEGFDKRFLTEDGASTSAVGTFPPNAYGLHDMVGNAWEWNWDWSLTSPNVHRTIRGGAYSYSCDYARLSSRSDLYTENVYSSIGFRTALTPNDQTTVAKESAAAPIATGSTLKLLPTPKELKVDDGQIPLTAEARIVATDASLVPLAEILSEEILFVTKMKLPVAEGESKPGDIVLKLNRQLQAGAEILTVHGQEVLKTREYAHTIAVTDRVVIEGWDYRATCEGTATLLQAIVIKGDEISIPKMTVKDWPYSDYGAIMPDCARSHQPLGVLKTAVETCRLYKIRYLHLHFADDSAFTFPSTAYPDASKEHYPPVTPYTLDELKELVAYADARGVTCVPELAGPGHCTALMNGLHGKIGDSKWRTMDVLNPTIYPVLDTLVGEMCDVFKSTPYFHCGGDEVEPAFYMANEHVQKYRKEHHLTGEHTMWLPYGIEMAKIIKKHGKKMIMWDGLPVGVPLDRELAKDVILYVWFPRKGRAREALSYGYTIITTPWDMPPLPEFSIFTNNGDVLTPQDKVLGHCRPMWEMDQATLALSYLAGAPERHERSWGPDNVIEEDYQKGRMAQMNQRAFSIVRPVDFKFEGSIDAKDNFFTQPITVSMSTIVPNTQIRYRIDGEEPTKDSPLYDKPFKAAESLQLRAAIFDEAGKRIGNVGVAKPLSYRNFEQNLTTGKPVKASAVAGEGKDADATTNANDGWVTLNKMWGAFKAPQWWQVDLEKTTTLDRIHIFLYWDASPVFQYNIEVSDDEKTWTKVVDAAANLEPATEKGFLHKFNPTPARYIRVNMLKNSAQDAVQIVELRAYEVGK